MKVQGGCASAWESDYMGGEGAECESARWSCFGLGAFLHEVLGDHVTQIASSTVCI